MEIYNFEKITSTSRLIVFNYNVKHFVNMCVNFLYFFTVTPKSPKSIRDLILSKSMPVETVISITYAKL